MALTTKEIQTQKALMEQEIEKLEAELKVKVDDYHDAFGTPKVEEKTSKFKLISIAIVIGIIGGVGLIYYLKTYHPTWVAF
jgi:hypothetical protein